MGYNPSRPLRDARGAVSDMPIDGLEWGKAVNPLPFVISKTDEVKVALRKKHEGALHKFKMDLPTMPGINALSFTIRYLPGGRNRFFEFVKLAMLNKDPTATAWWAVFADLPAHQRLRANLDDVCVAAGVKPSALLSAVVGHAMEASIDSATLVAAAMHPAVVAAATKSALRIDGEHAAIALEDRRALMQARGAIPTPKGTSINIQANASAAAASFVEPSVPKFADDMAGLVVQRQPLHEAIDADSLD